MALIDCEDCGSLVSDRATNCPRCGGPMGAKPQAIETPHVPDAATPAQSWAAAAIAAPAPAPEAPPSRMERGSGKGKEAWLMAGATLVMCGLIGAWLEGERNIVSIAAWAIGYGLLPLLIALLVLWRGKAETAWKTLIIILAICGFASWKAHERSDLVAADRAQARKEASEFREELAAYRNDPAAPAPAPPPQTAVPLKTASLSETDIVRIVRRVLLQSMQEHDRELQTARVEETIDAATNVLEPRNLVSFERIQAGRTTLAAAKVAIGRKEASMDQYNGLLDSRLAAEIPPKYAAFWSTYELGKTRRTNLWGAYFKIQNDVLDATGDTLDYMAGQVGSTSVVDGEIMFPDQQSLAMYRKYLGRISDLAVREQDVVDQINQLQQKATGDLGPQ